MNQPSIHEASFKVTSGIHGFLALCRTVDFFECLRSEFGTSLSTAPYVIGPDLILRKDNNPTQVVDMTKPKTYGCPMFLRWDKDQQAYKLEIETWFGPYDFQDEIISVKYEGPL